MRAAPRQSEVADSQAADAVADSAAWADRTAISEENDKSMRQSVGQNDETLRISAGHVAPGGQLF
jgi:hypothetical protein